MARVRTAFVCEQCGQIFPKWSGRCSECGTWNSVVETRVEEDRAKRAARASLPPSEPQPLPTISADGFQRISVPMEELNRVLGGGIVPGSMVLIGGDPGIGKSTLLLQVSSLLARQDGLVLYVSDEELIARDSQPISTANQDAS